MDFLPLQFVPLLIYNVLITIVYAALFLYVYKEDKNSQVIELQRPGVEEVR